MSTAPATRSFEEPVLAYLRAHPGWATYWELADVVRYATGEFCDPSDLLPFLEEMRSLGELERRGCMRRPGDDPRLCEWRSRAHG